MSVSTKCQCGRQLVAKDAAAGKRVKCPSCGSAVQLPLSDAGNDESDEQSANPQPTKQGTAKAKPAADKEKSKSAKPPTIRRSIIAGGIAALGLIGYLGYRLAFPPTEVQPPRPKELTEADVNAEINAILKGAGYTPPKIAPYPVRDYVEFRSQHKTKLTRQGGSPQQSGPIVAPPGTVEVAYSSGDLQLKAIYGYPTGSKKCPAVLFLHGGFGFGEDDWDMVKPFLDAGFAVMIPVLRGENGQPGNFTLYVDEVDDVLAATEVLLKQPQVNSERIFVAGHSAGGTLATFAVMASTRFRAGASFSGCLGVDSSTLGKPALVVYDEKEINEKELRSPNGFASCFKCPFRLFLGDQENWLEFDTKFTVDQAKKFNKDIEYIQVPGDHFTSVAPAIVKTIEFFKTKL